jgi:hypothetical protein
MNRKALTLVLLFFAIISALAISNQAISQANGHLFNTDINVDSPDAVIGILYDAIDHAKEKGDYKCCINPACTMCYLGHWKFEKGICHCDDAIAEGRFNDVCPECRSGIEAGLCSSSQDACTIEI